MSTDLSQYYAIIPRDMSGKQLQATLAILLFVTSVVLYFTFFPTYQWQGLDRALKAPNICYLDVPGPLLTYGSNKDAPEFTNEPLKGARVLLLAYAR